MLSEFKFQCTYVYEFLVIVCFQIREPIMQGGFTVNKIQYAQAVAANCGQGASSASELP